jgi:hypothetical protein
MSPGPEDEVSQDEKRRIIREQASSILDHARAAANDLGGGRYAGVNPTTVVGAEPAVKYPAASTSWQIQLPDEPPLGFDNPALDESSAVILPAELGAPVTEALSSAVQASPPADDVETSTGAPPSSEERNDG